jgi:ribosomal protein S18 acetylase RimI-like enzyme
MIRQGKESDFDALIKLLTEFSAEAGTSVPMSHLTNALWPLLQGTELGEILVLDIEEEIVGYLAIGYGWGIESGGKEALFDEIFIRSDFRNLGHGKTLIRHALAHVKNQGAKTVFLETEASNPDSRKLYQALGFETEDSIWMRA